MASYHRVAYTRAPDLEGQVSRMVAALGMDHIDISRLAVIRSTGTRSRRVLARCHALPRIFQSTLGVEAHYVIEVLSENFERLSQEQKARTLIHELMHIPRSFAGGFRHHGNHVTRRAVERAYRKYIKGSFPNLP